MINVRKLVWDAWNVDHIARHNVTPKEVEQAVADPNKKSKKGCKARVIILGRSGKRLLVVVLSEESDKRYYVITARDMDKKERLIYRRK